MLVIRRKDDALKILRYGNVVAGQSDPLGAFDVDVYEAVELDTLPDGFELVKEATVADQLTAVFDAQPVEAQAAFWQARVAVADALSLGKVAVAIAMVEQAVVPPELEPVRDALLAVLEGA